MQPQTARRLADALAESWREYNPPLDPMSLLVAEDLSISYGAQDVLQGVDLTVPHQARIALVGPNGVGKSSLLRVLSGLERPNRGLVRKARGLKVGYLPQTGTEAGEIGVGGDLALYDLALSAFTELREMERRLVELEEMMADPREAESAMAEYGPLQEAFERGGGYSYHAMADKVLRGLGFDSGQFDQSVGQLSGGERTRAQLARLLLKDPDLLLLDEPTNHLDISGMVWLEGWLQSWPGALVVVSHDRAFLDKVIDHVLEVHSTELEEYRGNYSSCASQREERFMRRKALLEQQQKHVEKEQDYIRRNIAGQNTRQAQGRRTRLQRFLTEEALTERRKAPSIQVTLSSDHPAGRIILETDGLAITNPEGDLLAALPKVEVGRKERVAVIGPNGAGKTTLVRSILEEIEQGGSSIQPGANALPG